MRDINKNLTEGPTGKQLVQLTWPMLLGLTGMVVFNLVDTYFIGKLGVQQLAAMGFCFPVVMFVNSLSHGVGIGTSSLVSRNIVSTHRNTVKLMASRAVLLGIIIVAIFVVAGLLTIRPLFIALGAGPEILGHINDYMSVWYYGVAFVVVPMIGNNIVRATGDTFTPGMLMVISAIINAILDPLLIFGIGPFPEMGMKGAALATVISRSSGLVFILIVLIRREKLLSLHLGRFQEIMKTWRDVLSIAGPASLALLITPVSIGLITRIISGFGKEAVAAFGVASRIETFALMMISALGSVLIIFMGQNISQKKFPRIFQALKYAGYFSLVWGGAIFVLLVFFAEPVSALFSDHQEVVNITSQYLKTVGMSYGFQGLVMVSMSCFNGLNKPLPSTFFSVLRMLALYVPLAWVGSLYFGLPGVFWAALLANFVSGILAFLFLIRTVRKLRESEV
ncbi:putative efflux protein, MATE family [Mariniphaga anaerophila]|uniref:Putative efflux protein, MATE family n=1 Tax=Mariniphaga anaerophila TaxID=1484053 RepID=A0A1M5FFI0_9BACT|nr:MATE family efflux transporter [Mariniphaga anaerophila]SHF90283.1 putative efflux protein, MATE family [Mariniphaga anaerophila]